MVRSNALLPDIPDRMKSFWAKDTVSDVVARSLTFSIFTVGHLAAGHQMVPICMEWWCTEANEATQTHCCNPVAPAYPIWAYYAHGWQRRCQEDPVSLSSGRLEKTTRSSPHHVAQHRPTGSETTPPYAPRSSRFGSEPPSVEDDVEVWRYAILSCMPETTTMTIVGQVGWTLCRHGLTRDSANVVILFTVSILFASFAEIFVQIS